MVFQDPYGSLDPHLTAQEIVAEPLRGPRGAVRSAQRDSGRRADRPGRPARTALERRPAEFSGGQRQRIGIARALASQARAAGLRRGDQRARRLRAGPGARLLADLQEETGLTYLFISHNLGVVREISADTVVMSAGKIVEIGRPTTGCSRPPRPTPAPRAARRSTRPP